MTIEEFKELLRKAFDENVAAQDQLVKSFAAQLDQLTAEATATPGADKELVATVFAVEVHRYGQKLGKL